MLFRYERKESVQMIFRRGNVSSTPEINVLSSFVSVQQKKLNKHSQQPKTNGEEEEENNIIIKQQHTIN